MSKPKKEAVVSTQATIKTLLQKPIESGTLKGLRKHGMFSTSKPVNDEKLKVPEIKKKPQEGKS